MFELRSGHWRAVHASSARGVLSFVVRVRRARSPLRVRLSEELGPKEIKTLGERSTDGGVGLGLGVIPGKWVCPNCLGSAWVPIARRGMVGRGREVQKGHLRYTTGPGRARSNTRSARD